MLPRCVSGLPPSVSSFCWYYCRFLQQMLSVYLQVPWLSLGTEALCVLIRPQLQSKTILHVVLNCNALVLDKIGCNWC